MILSVVYHTDLYKVLSSLIPMDSISNIDSYIATNAPWLPTLILAIILLIVVSAIFMNGRSRRFFVSHLKELALLIWMLGVALYFWGFYGNDAFGQNIATILLKSIMSSFKMFATQSDMSETAKEWREVPYHMAYFAFLQFSALLVSIGAIIHLIGIRASSSIRIWSKHTWLFSLFGCLCEDNYYIIWGVNDKSKTLARSICEHYKNEKDKNYRIVLVNTPTDTNSQLTQRSSFFHFFTPMVLRKNEMMHLEDLDALIAYSNANLSPNIVPDSRKKTNILATVGLANLAKLLKKRAVKHLYFFFLSDDEKQNVTAASALRQAVVEYDDVVLSGKEMDIYLHARRTTDNQVFEDMKYFQCDMKGLAYHLVDSSALAIESLKRLPKSHPVHYVNPDVTLGKATKPFSALIIGFGETGQEAFKFLYEFAAFGSCDKVEKDKKNEIAQKNPFHFTLMDLKMNALRDDFLMRVPALKNKENVDNNPKNELSFLQMANVQVGFWEKMEELIKELDYVVIAVGSDEVGMQLAVDLYEFAYRNQKHDFSIFVRAYTAASEQRMESIARYYTEKNRIMNSRLEVFGQVRNQYTYDNIIRETILKEAIMFYDSYNKVNDDKTAKSWEKRHQINEDPNLITLDKVYNVRRKEAQDMANSLHKETKIDLIGNDLNTIRSLHLFYNAKNACEKNLGKEEFKRIELIAENLAITEHVRWVAAHELLGYTFPDPKPSILCGRQDHIAKTHECIIGWDELDQLDSDKTLCDYRKYDHMVVKTSIALALKALNKDSKIM